MKNEDNENRKGSSSKDNGNTSEIEVAARRSRIEHTRNIELSEQEIIARKKAHAEHRAKQRKKKNSAAGSRQELGAKKRDKRKASSGKPSRMSFEQARNNSDSKRDVIGRSKSAPAEPLTDEPAEELLTEFVPDEPAKTEPAPEKPVKTVNKEAKPKTAKKKKQKPVKEQQHIRTLPSEPFGKPRFKPVEMPSYIENPAAESKDKDDSEETVDMQDFRRRRKRLKMKKRLKRLLLVLVLAVIAAVIYFTRGLWVPKLEGIFEKPRETIVNDGAVQAGNFPIDLSEGNITGVTRLDGSVVTVDGSHYTVYESDGKVRDTVYHTLGSPVVRSSGKRMLLFDNGSDTLKLYNRSGEMFEKKLDATIVYGAVGSNGNVLAVTLDDKNAARITVFDKNGKELYKWANGDRIMDASFNSSGDGFTAATFSVADGKLRSKITRVELTGDYAVFVSDPIDGLVIRTAENSKGNIWAMTRDKLVLVSEVGRILGSYSFPSEPVAFDLCSDCVCAVTKQITTGQMIISIFDALSETAEPKLVTPASGEPKKVICFDSLAFVLSSGRLDAYAPDSTLAATAAVADDYTDFVYCGSAVYLIGKREMNKIVFKT